MLIEGRLGSLLGSPENIWRSLYSPPHDTCKPCSKILLLQLVRASDILQLIYDLGVVTTYPEHPTQFLAGLFNRTLDCDWAENKIISTKRCVLTLQAVLNLLRTPIEGVLTEVFTYWYDLQEENQHNSWHVQPQAVTLKGKVTAKAQCLCIS